LWQSPGSFGGNWNFAAFGVIEPTTNLYPRPTRRYAVSYSRWLSPDPENAGADVSDPQSWNAYSYVANNPMSRTDPEGESYEVCQVDSGGKTVPGSCGTIKSDDDFKKFQLQTADLLDFSGDHAGGTISADGKFIGTYRYTEVDNVATNPVADLLAGAGGAGLVRAVVGGLTRAAAEEGLLSFLGRLGTEEAGSLTIGEGPEEVSLTQHALKRALQRAITKADINEAVKSAKIAGDVSTQIGKYGTPQQVFTGKNGVVVVIENVGRNAGKSVTVWRK
ncbi:MAG: hypothetical protein DMG22_16405, partial [Acidobacteria bacterium]